MVLVLLSTLALPPASMDQPPIAARYGKRSAQAQFPALAALNIPSTPVSPGGGGYGKRSAEPHGTGVAFHPGLATSFNGPTTYGLPHYGKRDAEAEASPDAEADADAF